MLFLKRQTQHRWTWIHRSTVPCFQKVPTMPCHLVVCLLHSVCHRPSSYHLGATPPLTSTWRILFKLLEFTTWTRHNFLSEAIFHKGTYIMHKRKQTFGISKEHPLNNWRLRSSRPHSNFWPVLQIHAKTYFQGGHLYITVSHILPDRSFWF